MQQPVAKIEVVPVDYRVLLESIKKRIRDAQIKAALAVNLELVLLYWQIGQEIISRQEREGWGTKIVEQLARDLRSTFPEMSGFSPRNLNYMRAFGAAYTDEAIVQLFVAKIPWGHNIALIEKVKDPAERLWYAEKTVENGWSRAVLVHQIESKLYKRQGSAISNFHATLPEPQSDLAHQLIKDPYTFEFLTLNEEIQERDLEQGLVDHIQKFLLELGMGFAFVGRQYHLEVGGEDFYLDLLFYHTRLHCYVVIDLKVEKFKPEFAGKMNFYLAAIDDLLRHPGDQASIGMILCKEKNRVIVEYSLRDTRKPIGVAEYVLSEHVPTSLAGQLPTVKQVKDELEIKLTVSETSRVEKK